MSARVRRVEIVGAGIAGLAAAAALAARGWRVRVHERSAAIRAAGSGIYIWENGLRVLEAIGAFEQAVAGAHWGKIRETRNERNEVTAVHRFDTERHGRVVSIVRQQLMDALRQAAESAGAEIRLRSHGVRAHPDGAIDFADGASAEADLVIAADGVNSQLRDSLGLLRRRRVLGDGAIRFLIPRTEEERISPDGRKYIEYWSGARRILYTPCNPETVYLALTALNGDDAARALPFPTDTWIASFPFLGDLLRRISGPGRWDDFETVRLRRWSAGRVGVIGDAACAQAPNLGQGGGCALMGAVSLAATLDEIADVPSALAAWERRERPLYEQTQRFSSFLSSVTRWPNAVRSGFFSLAGRSEWFSRLRWRAARHRPFGT
jgi:2-polyprenyl-6-methoxyphenol hydroxylase-like FAD-dependent oxidoreductase